MSVLRGFFHPLFLVVVLVAATLYLNRDTLFLNRDHSVEMEAMLGKVESLINDIQSQPFATEGNSEPEAGVGAGNAAVSGEGIPSVLDTVTTDVPLETLTPRVGDAVALEGEAVAQRNDDREPTSSQEEEAPLSVDSALSEPVPEEPEENLVSQVTSPDMADGVTTDAVMDTPEQAHQAVAAPTPSDSADHIMPPSPQAEAQLWYQARLAAWNGDAQRAIEGYRSIIALQPDNPDAYGEMGNVMLYIGDREGAAEAYYQAALRLVKAGNAVMAWRMLNVIAGLSPPKAEQLYQELRRP